MPLAAATTQTCLPCLPCLSEGSKECAEGSAFAQKRKVPDDGDESASYSDYGCGLTASVLLVYEYGVKLDRNVATRLL